MNPLLQTSANSKFEGVLALVIVICQSLLNVLDKNRSNSVLLIIDDLRFVSACSVFFPYKNPDRLFKEIVNYSQT